MNKSFLSGTFDRQLIFQSGDIFEQKGGILIDTYRYCAHLIADPFLYFLATDLIYTIFQEKKMQVATILYFFLFHLYIDDFIIID